VPHQRGFNQRSSALKTSPFQGAARGILLLDFPGRRILSLATCTHKRRDHRAATKVERDSWLEISGGCRIITSPSPGRRGRGEGEDATRSCQPRPRSQKIRWFFLRRGRGGGREEERTGVGSQEQREPLSLRSKTRDNRDCHLLACFGTPIPGTRAPPFFFHPTPSPLPLLTGRILARSRERNARASPLSLSSSSGCLSCRRSSAPFVPDNWRESGHFVFGSAPSSGIKIRPVSRDVDAFSEERDRVLTGDTGR